MYSRSTYTFLNIAKTWCQILFKTQKTLSFSYAMLENSFLCSLVTEDLVCLTKNSEVWQMVWMKTVQMREKSENIQTRVASSHHRKKKKK